MDYSRSNAQKKISTDSNALKPVHIKKMIGNKYVERINQQGIDIPYLTGQKPINHNASLKGNIENFIGYMQLPVGLAGPLLVNGDHAQGLYNIPMATSEGCLVASYSRGMKACQLSGGVTSICIKESVQRTPYFKFKNLRTCLAFIKWAKSQFAAFQSVVSRTSNYAQLDQLDFSQEGNSVTLCLQFTTGDAAGQNMVTIATDAICKYILGNFQHWPIEWYIESNYAGDKKTTAKTLSNNRGKKVIAEVTIPKQIVADVLKSSPEKMCKYFLASTLSSIQAGSIGNQGHLANALTAIYLATGQDVACVAESSIGILRMETTNEGDLYASITMPALIVGTIGGGTHLPTQAEGLRIMNCKGVNKAQKFAELCCAAALAGELSIAAAIAEDHFTSAHQSLGRK